MNHMPFPSNDHTQDAPPQVQADPTKPPWRKLQPTELTPLTFEIEFRSGEIATFAYSDFRGVKLLHAGYLIISVLGMEKYHVIVEGRQLSDLARLISLGKIHGFRETPFQGYEVPENVPHIESVTVDILTGPY